MAMWEVATVFTRFVARALIFFNLTHCRAPIQTDVYLSTGACYFQSKITTKLIVEDIISRHLIFLHMI